MQVYCFIESVISNCFVALLPLWVSFFEPMGGRSAHVVQKQMQGTYSMYCQEKKHILNHSMLDCRSITNLGHIFYLFFFILPQHPQLVTRSTVIALLMCVISLWYCRSSASRFSDSLFGTRIVIFLLRKMFAFVSLTLCFGWYFVTQRPVEH